MFSGTAFTTSKFVFLRNNGKTFPHLKFLKQDLHGISSDIGEYHSDIPQFWLGHIVSRDAF